MLPRHTGTCDILLPRHTGTCDTMKHELTDILIIVLYYKAICLPLYEKNTVYTLKLLLYHFMIYDYDFKYYSNRFNCIKFKFWFH